jgi:hypothetical protein
MNSARADYLKVGSAAMRRVKDAFDENGISMPSDIHTVNIGNLEEAASALGASIGGSQDADMNVRTWSDRGLA